MKITFAGTRGSVPISNPKAVRYGGNTTSQHIVSSCIPSAHRLVVDAGSGIVPLGHSFLNEAVTALYVLFTHFHHDHTQGLLLMPLTFIKTIMLHLLGPEERDKGPREMMEDMMRPPYFPMDFAQVASHFHCKAIKHPAAMVGVFHPVAGAKLVPLDEFERAEQSPGAQLAMNGRQKVPIAECLVIRMLRTNHPERTISYRFEERPTGQVYVLLTDHENMDGLPLELKRHLQNADLLVMDSQYSRDRYDRVTAGYGHGTPDYCVRTAHAVGAKRLGLTHHDPMATDADVDAILEEAKKTAADIGYTGDIFACADYMVVDLTA